MQEAILAGPIIAPVNQTETAPAVVAETQKPLPKRTQAKIDRRALIVGVMVDMTMHTLRMLLRLQKHS